MMRKFNQQKCCFLWLIASLLLPDLVDCMNGSITDSDKGLQRRKAQSYQLSRAYSHHQGCVDDMYSSDLDGDMKLSEDEYVLFISKRSRGEIGADGYTELPFSLISTFIYGSCFCSYMSHAPFCCVGGAARIDLDSSQSKFIEDNLITICRTVDEAIKNEIGTFGPSPTIEPSFKPSDVTQSPTSAPSVAPSAAPSAAPTEAQTSEAPTIASTGNLTEFPSPAPSIFIDTPPPEPDALACVNFQYGIRNDEGLTSADIENEIGNSYKSDLIVATRFVTIQALNETFPEDAEERALRKASTDRSPSKTHKNRLTIVNLGRFGLDEYYSPQGERISSILAVKDEGKKFRRRTAYLPVTTENRISNMDSRRLVFYSDSNPPVISSIFDNSHCPELRIDGIVCSIVDTKVCVTLEEGDDEDDVKEALLDGIEKSFDDGSFASAIP